MATTKTTALRIARAAVSQPQGRGSSWQVIGPYRTDDLHGPSTAVSADSFWRARAKRAEWVVSIALTLMAHRPEDVEHAVWAAIEDGCSDIDGILAASLKTLAE